ncbi:MAG: desulfoferrodoxin [Clostridia bacterium]|nr:desulfoferrodoxin [Clostridia bacterium]
MKDVKFFICEHCGNIITMVEDKGVPVMCCGQKMTQMEVKTEDGGFEKHVPVITVDGKNVKVDVGSVAHPMLPEHSIRWICVQTDKGISIKYLEVGAAPAATFALADDEKLIAVYEFCNIHGLWKAEA